MKLARASFPIGALIKESSFSLLALNASLSTPGSIMGLQTDGGSGNRSNLAPVERSQTVELATKVQG